MAMISIERHIGKAGAGLALSYLLRSIRLRAFELGAGGLIQSIDTLHEAGPGVGLCGGSEWPYQVSTVSQTRGNDRLVQAMSEPLFASLQEKLKYFSHGFKMSG